MKSNVLIRLENVTKSYDGQIILDNFSLDIEQNAFITLLGPSGCGKTTTLRIIGGFEKLDQGGVYHKDQNISDMPPYKRNINTVLSNHFPVKYFK